MKTCYRCGAGSSAVAFSVDRSKADGLSIYCKECQNAKNRAQYAKDPERGKAYVRRYQATEAGKAVAKKVDQARYKTPEHRARCMVRNRVKRHKMPAAGFWQCADCSKPAQHYHHEDYSFWWSVEALCNACHVQRHRRF